MHQDRFQREWFAFPERFESIEDGRAVGQAFFRWYNHAHHHSGLGFLTSAVVHGGEAATVRDHRQHVLAAAYGAHPERFVKDGPRRADLPQAVWINPADEENDRSGMRPRNDDRHLGRPARVVPIRDAAATLVTSPLVSECH